jgi:hypothetical protein
VAIPTAIGLHGVWRTGDIVGMRFKGPIVRDDIAAMRAMAEELLAEHGRCFLLSDMTACSGIDAEARKYMAQWSKERTQKVTATAVYGVNFAMRALVTLSLNAIKFLGTQQVEVVFVKDEAEAFRYVERKRSELDVEDDHVAR